MVWKQWEIYGSHILVKDGSDHEPVVPKVKKSNRSVCHKAK